MVNRKILRMTNLSRNNVEFTVTTSCVPLLTVIGVADVRPVPIPELSAQGNAERFLVDEDYVMYVICKGQLPGTKVTAKVSGKNGGSISKDSNIDENGEGLLRIGFAVANGTVQS